MGLLDSLGPGCSCEDALCLLSGDSPLIQHFLNPGDMNTIDVTINLTISQEILGLVPEPQPRHGQALAGQCLDTANLEPPSYPNRYTVHSSI